MIRTREIAEEIIGSELVFLPANWLENIKRSKRSTYDELYDWLVTQCDIDPFCPPRCHFHERVLVGVKLYEKLSRLNGRRGGNSPNFMYGPHTFTGTEIVVLSDDLNSPTFSAAWLRLSERERTRHVNKARKHAHGVTFKKWLLSNIDRPDPVGDLALDVKRDANFPGHENLAGLVDYLVDHNATPDAIDALKDAFAEYCKSSIVYFVQAGDGPIKIGYCTTAAETRLSTLQTAHAQELRLLATMPGTIHDEKSLHARFAAHHRRGEWFAPHPDLLEFIAGLTQ